MVIFGLSFAIRKDAYSKMMKYLSENDELLMVITSMAALVIGLAMVLKHNLWGNTTEIIITLVGWLSIAKGISLAFMPNTMIKVSDSMMKYLSVTALVFTGLGVYLSYMTYIV